MKVLYTMPSVDQFFSKSLSCLIFFAVKDLEFPPEN